MCINIILLLFIAYGRDDPRPSPRRSVFRKSRRTPRSWTLTVNRCNSRVCPATLAHFYIKLWYYKHDDHIRPWHVVKTHLLNEHPCADNNIVFRPKSRVYCSGFAGNRIPISYLLYSPDLSSTEARVPSTLPGTYSVIRCDTPSQNDVNLQPSSVGYVLLLMRTTLPSTRCNTIHYTHARPPQSHVSAGRRICSDS